MNKIETRTAKRKLANADNARKIKANTTIGKPSISGLNINISKLYRLGAMMGPNKTIKSDKNSIFLDFQFLGQLDVETAIENIVTRIKLNSLYLNEKTNIKNLLSNSSTNMTKLKYLPDDLMVPNDYDFLDDTCSYDPIFAGKVTKMSRSPIVNVYRLKSPVEFREVETGTDHSVGQENKTNYAIYCGDSKKSIVYLCANPNDILEYVESYFIDFNVPTMIRQFKMALLAKKLIEEYRSIPKHKEMILNDDQVATILMKILVLVK